MVDVEIIKENTHELAQHSAAHTHTQGKHRIQFKFTHSFDDDEDDSSLF